VRHTKRGGWPYSQPPNVQFEINHASPQSVGLVAWYPALASRGATGLRDLAGRGLDGTFKDVGEPAWVTSGEFGSVLQFDGADDYVAIPQFVIGVNESWTLWTRFYVSAWVNDRAGLWRGPFGTNQDYIGFRSDKVYLEDDANIWYQIVGTGDYSLGTWHDLAIIFTAADVVAYQNGRYIGNSHRGPLVNSLTVNRLGEGYAGNAINGFIAEARVYNRIVPPSTLWQSSDRHTRYELYEPRIRRFLGWTSPGPPPVGGHMTLWGRYWGP